MNGNVMIIHYIVLATVQQVLTKFVCIFGTVLVLGEELNVEHVLMTGSTRPTW